MCDDCAKEFIEASEREDISLQLDGIQKELKRIADALCEMAFK